MESEFQIFYILFSVYAIVDIYFSTLMIWFVY